MNDKNQKDLKVKKLRLSRETIRNLQEAELDVVFGGCDAAEANSDKCCTCARSHHC